jgi:hypothetical protein
MRSYHSVVLKGFHHPMENEPSAHGGDEEPDYASNRSNSHGANSPHDIFGKGQAQIGHKLGRQNGAHDSEK